jgi:sugar diacid utilization regulator
MLNVAAGVSSADWDASSAARAYGESIRALRIALADPTANAISRWDRAGAFRALTLLPVAGPDDPIDPRVRTLLEHPPLARTVETFLDRAGDAAATARTLRIHRATLYQRLARVDELCALDVQRSGEDRLTAHVGLRLAALAADRRRGPERRARNDVE